MVLVSNKSVTTVLIIIIWQAIIWKIATRKIKVKNGRAGFRRGEDEIKLQGWGKP